MLFVNLFSFFLRFYALYQGIIYDDYSDALNTAWANGEDSLAIFAVNFRVTVSEEEIQKLQMLELSPEVTHMATVVGKVANIEGASDIGLNAQSVEVVSG